MAEMSQKTGLPVSYALLQNPMDKDGWRKLLKMTDEAVPMVPISKPRLLCAHRG